MKLEVTKLGLYAGYIIPIWLALGVFTAGMLYPEYSHMHQAMSELGAADAPTSSVSPVINNYPLGVLFIVFGYTVLISYPASKLAKVSGLLIILHGIGSMAAGYFACDLGCNPEVPSASQVLHNLSGLVMFLSITVAGFIWVYLGWSLLRLKRFAWFSLGCALIAIAVLPAMASAVESGVGFGLYQRINYGASVVWIAGLALVSRGEIAQGKIAVDE